MVLSKHRRYQDFLQTNQSTWISGSTAPLLLISQAAPVADTDTFLRLRCSFSASVAVGSVAPPPEAWWSVTQLLLIAWWSDSGSTAIGATSGSSEHYLGTKLFSPTLVASPTAPTEYYVTYHSDGDLVTQTSRKGSGVNTPHVGIGVTVYDPYSALDGTYTSIAANWQGHLVSYWGSI
jgi:hypothetical protein